MQSSLLKRTVRSFFLTCRCRHFSTSLGAHHDVKSQNCVILSGIQPTGVPHLGNYFGALANWVKLQREAGPDDVLLYMVASWHALTLPQDPAQLANARNDTLAALLAIGLDPKRSIIFHQDTNRDHAELAWIFNCISSTGMLRRMTTWKSRLATSRNMSDDADVDEGSLNAGLFTYPVLQAADILVYNSTHVPVGDDQTQHVELCRDIAERFNHTFSPDSPLFTLPALLKTSSKRILSLRDPSSKMSKSAPDVSSRILLTDDASQIASKIRVAVTDSIQGITYDPVNRPGTANLLTILAACTNENVADVALRYQDKNHGHIKRDLTEVVEETLKGPRIEFGRLRKDAAYLREVALDGAARSAERSEAVMRKVREAIGLPSFI
ncbi:tryptophanyl-tRNA synthetase [Guyanagaster necrorhizus]|uniref:tryptophan--tRNA ligase n=1 Tax=Guyanagaster necrorhizus TaxID=856835 RepID=A0A9P8B0G7_9AGAR|nr:tryptophanyl-tRNA synthetase [Guyanagaster necrorhizus MCA 3950]KAG7453082.1 tryptophanyl-tRNA synthetase [Guyanagaster necrorhizus MCA 3950]